MYYYDVKQVLARSLLTLLQEQPIQNISVRQITEQCDISSRTFYNYFSDKYDLMHYLYYSLNEECCFDGKQLVSYKESYITCGKMINQHWISFQRIFEYAGQNNIRPFVLKKTISNINRQFLWNGHKELTIDPEMRKFTYLIAHSTVSLLEYGISGHIDYTFSVDSVLAILPEPQKSALLEIPLPKNPYQIEIFNPRKPKWPPKLYL